MVDSFTAWTEKFKQRQHPLSDGYFKLLSEHYRLEFCLFVPQKNEDSKLVLTKVKMIRSREHDSPYAIHLIKIFEEHQADKMLLGYTRVHVEHSEALRQLERLEDRLVGNEAGQHLLKIEYLKRANDFCKTANDLKQSGNNVTALQRLEQAYEFYHRAAESKDALIQEQALFGQISCFIELSKIDQARELLQRNKDKLLPKPTFHYLHAKILRKQHEYGSALSAINKALIAMPYNRGAHTEQKLLTRLQSAQTPQRLTRYKEAKIDDIKVDYCARQSDTHSYNICNYSPKS